MTTETVNLAEGGVGDDLACSRCGYNLRTLAAAGVCPECGQPVLVAIQYDRARRGHWHAHAGSGYGRWMRSLSHTMLLAVLTAVIGVFVPINRRWIDALDVVGAAVVWTMGCWVLWSAGARPALPPAQRWWTAPLRAMMRTCAAMALAWPVALEVSDRVTPWAPWVGVGRLARHVAEALGCMPALGSAVFFLYVGVVGWQTFRRAMLPLAVVLAAAAVVVFLASAAEHPPFRWPRGAVGFTAEFGRFYLPVVGPVRSELTALRSHSVPELAGAALLCSLSFLVWAAFSFAWSARCYEIHEAETRDPPSQ